MRQSEPVQTTKVHLIKVEQGSNTGHGSLNDWRERNRKHTSSCLRSVQCKSLVPHVDVADFWVPLLSVMVGIKGKETQMRKHASKRLREPSCFFQALERADVSGIEKRVDGGEVEGYP